MKALCRSAPDGDEDEPEQPEPRDDVRVQAGQPRPLASIRLGGIDLEIE